MRKSGGLSLMVLVVLVSVVVIVQAKPAAPVAEMGTAFTYQGRLDDAGAPANGSYDFEFRLYNGADSATATLLGTQAHNAVSVSKGLFTVQLDFDAAPFDGQALWLEIHAGPTGETLTAQPITPVPYALHSPTPAHQAGRAVISTSIGMLNHVPFTQPFATIPAVQLQIEGDISVEGVTPRLNEVTTTGFTFTVMADDHEVIAWEGRVGQNTSLTMVNGEPAISFLNADTLTLNYASRSSIKWTVETVDTIHYAHGGATTSLAVINEQPAISYSGGQNDLKYARYDGSDWATETVDSTGEVGQYSSLALIGGQPAISYYDNTNADLKYARYDGAAWKIETVDSIGAVGQHTSLAEVNGQPAISYCDTTNDNLKYARYDGSVWRIEVVGDTNNLWGYTSLAVVDGQPAISYSTGHLKYARYDGANWQVQFVNPGNGMDSRSYTSLAALNGYPVISYYDGMNKDLKVVRYDGDAWQLQTVDSKGYVGFYTSLAIVDGSPAISYYDYTNEDLKYVRLRDIELTVNWMAASP